MLLKPGDRVRNTVSWSPFLGQLGTVVVKSAKNASAIYNEEYVYVAWDHDTFAVSAYHRGYGLARASRVDVGT